MSFWKAKTLSVELNQRKYTFVNKIFHGATIPKRHYNLILTHMHLTGLSELNRDSGIVGTYQI